MATKISVADIISARNPTQRAKKRNQSAYERIATLPGYDKAWAEDFEVSPHLRDYVTELLEYSADSPVLVDVLQREFGKNKSPNYIYRAGGEVAGNRVYVHIYTEKVSKQMKYRCIDPKIQEHRAEIMDEIDKRVALLIDDETRYNSPETKMEYLFEMLDQMVKIGKNNDFGGVTQKIDPMKKENPKKIDRSKKMTVDKATYKLLRYEIYSEKIGSSLLEPLIRDSYIEDIHCAGRGPIHVSHKTFGTLETSLVIDGQEELDAFVLNLSEIVGKPASHRDPIIDAKMPDGSRLNLVFGEDVSTRGSNFTIRKFSDDPLSITQIIAWGTMSTLLAAYCWMILENKMSLWICGETASGKTTTLSAITMFIPDTYKIVSIEEVPEVHAPHKNWIREVVRETGNAASEEKEAV
ncbi:MAG: type II/IV secretion system ATPase subunit, partial [Deltaproteobacteria bacterium]|nr:type II/IV secretion system ATPase subunit [Deltaproteobacteria bacterium]